MKMHRFEVYVIDHEDIGIHDMKVAIEQDSDFMFKVKAAQTTDIGDWHDGHELNMTASGADVYRKYFRK